MPKCFPCNNVDDEILCTDWEHEWWGLWNVEESFSSHPAIISAQKIRQDSTHITLFYNLESS